MLIVGNIKMLFSLDQVLTAAFPGWKEAQAGRD
jgi:hypothetical protein